MSAMNTTKGMTKGSIALYVALLIVALAAPKFVYSLLLVNILCFALYACGYNLLIGYTGYISFGHSAFMGTSAFITGYVLTQSMPTEIGLLAGVLVATLVGYLMGILAIRREGLYFGMITLAQSQFLYFIYAMAPFTGGENGLQDVPRGKLLGFISLSSDVNLYYFVLAVFVACFLFIYRCVHSPFGHTLIAIRENEQRAISLGYDVERFKLIAFMLSAAISGLAGGLKTLSFGIATLNDAHWSSAADVLIMTLVGGVGTMWGPVIGAGLVVFLQHYLAERFVELLSAAMGVMFVLCVLVFRRGIVGEIAAWLKKRRLAATKS